MNARDLIRALQLQPHPEGGYYRETYRCIDTLTTGDGKKRNTSTAIFFLLEGRDRSAFHRISSDELWFFHQGQSIQIDILNGERTILLGNDIENGETPQAMIPANTWFAARIKDGSGYALVSCTVAPGFDFADFELSNKEELIQQFPGSKALIEEYFPGQ